MGWPSIPICVNSHQFAFSMQFLSLHSLALKINGVRSTFIAPLSPYPPLIDQINVDLTPIVFSAGES